MERQNISSKTTNNNLTRVNCLLAGRDGCMHAWMDRWTDGWMDGWMKRYIILLLPTYLCTYILIQLAIRPAQPLLSTSATLVGGTLRG